MQELHNENQVFLLYFLIFVFQNTLDMTDTRTESGLCFTFCYTFQRSREQSQACLARSCVCVNSPLCGMLELAQLYVYATAPPPLNSVGLTITSLPPCSFPSSLSLSVRNNLILLASRMKEWEAGG